jgi:hypothetical protein
MTEKLSPFGENRRSTPTGNEFWSSRDFTTLLGYTDYRNFESLIEKARTACFNSGQSLEDHFVEITEMIEIGKGGQRPIKTVIMSRYACYLSAPRRLKKSSVARRLWAKTRPTEHITRSAHKSARPSRKWVAPCQKICRQPRAFSSWRRRDISHLRARNEIVQTPYVSQTTPLPDFRTS